MVQKELSIQRYKQKQKLSLSSIGPQVLLEY
jgi:hypothetical protein